MLYTINNLTFDVHLNESGYYVDNKTGQFVHRIIAGKKFDRELECWEEVHHIDRNRLNNDPRNLFICTHLFHRLIHDKDIQEDDFWDFIEEMREKYTVICPKSPINLFLQTYSLR